MTEPGTLAPTRTTAPGEPDFLPAPVDRPGSGAWAMALGLLVLGALLAAWSVTRYGALVVTPVRLLSAVAGIALAAAGFRRVIRLAVGPATDPLMWFCGIFLAVLVLASALVDLLPLPEGTDPALTLTEPSLASPDLVTDHPLGTDTAGLDILAQALEGARVSLVVAGGATVVAMLVGGLLGLVAGFARGRVDAVIGLVADSVMSFPPLVLLMAMVTLLRPTMVNLTVALALIVVPNFVRLARANTIKVASREFVTASRTLGARPPTLLFRVVMPNVVPSLIAYGCVLVGILAVAEGSLSFLGLGIQRPLPTWGNMIAQGQPYLETAPHLVIVPAAALFLTVLSINYVGQRLQERWNP